MRFMIKKIIVPIIIFIFAAGGVYYWFQAQKIESVVISTVSSAAEGLIAHIVKGEGIDIKNKLNITYKPMLPGDTERSLRNRDVEIGTHGVLVLAKANLEGKELRAIAPVYYNVYSLLVLKDSPYQTIEDLIGKKLAVQPKISAAFTGPQTALYLKGISLDKDFQLSFGNASEAGKFLDQREVDAAFFFEPIASKKIATGKYREILEVQKLWRESTGKTFPYLVFAAYEDWLQTHQSIAKKYRKSYLEAANLIVKNPDILDKYKGFIKENLGIETDEEFKVLKQRFPKTLVTEWNQGVINDMKYILEKTVEFGILSEIPKKEIILELK